MLRNVLFFLLLGTASVLGLPDAEPDVETQHEGQLYVTLVYHEC
jgi:hypothetical protein